MERSKEPFHFKTHITVTELTGRRAADLKELLDNLRDVTPSVIYFHTHHFLEQHHYLSPEPPNDFAYWVTNALQETTLGERLAAIDTIQFPSIAGLREALIATIEKHVKSTKGALRRAPAGEELYFMGSRSLILPTPYSANTLAEFAEALKKISVQSLYYHIFEARLRLQRGNDFANWLEELGEKQIAQQITKMDPYTQTLDGLRKRLLQMIERRLRETQRVTA